MIINQDALSCNVIEVTKNYTLTQPMRVQSGMPSFVIVIPLGQKSVALIERWLLYRDANL